MERNRPRGALTNWRRQREGLVKTPKEMDRPRRTHHLKTAEGGTGQDMERNRRSKGHSLPGDDRGRDLLGHGKKSTKRGALTNWRWQIEGLVRTGKETDQARGTHVLETIEGETCQDRERNRPSEGHSHTGDGRGKNLSGHEGNRPSEGHSRPENSRGRDLSGYGKKSTKQGALTNWRQERERYFSGHGKKPTRRGARTNWRR